MSGARAGEIGLRLEEIHARIAQAARAAGRDASEVRVVAVTKRLGEADIRAAWEAGHRDFGENYVQEAAGKIAALSPGMPGARWHLIGRLQSNKAAVAVPLFTLLHAVDSESTVKAVSRAALRERRTTDVLLQIRLGRRGAADARERGGIEPEDAASFLESAGVHEGVRFTGVMGVADPDLEARPQFAGLRELAARLSSLGLPRAPLGELSMGMTGDYEDAVAEGATIVRIGTAIFGERPRG